MRAPTDDFFRTGHWFPVQNVINLHQLTKNAHLVIMTLITSVGILYKRIMGLPQIALTA